MAKSNSRSKSFLDPLFKLKPKTYFIIIVVLLLFIIFRPDCMLLEGNTNKPRKRNGRSRSRRRQPRRRVFRIHDLSPDVKGIFKKYFEKKSN